MGANSKLGALKLYSFGSTNASRHCPRGLLALCIFVAANDLQPEMLRSNAMFGRMFATTEVAYALNCAGSSQVRIVELCRVLCMAFSLAPVIVLHLAGETPPRDASRCVSCILDYTIGISTSI